MKKMLSDQIYLLYTINSVCVYLCVYKGRGRKKERKRERMIFPKDRSYIKV